MTQKVPMTVIGAARLRAELQELKTVARPRIIAAIAEARSHGDLKETAEYHAAPRPPGPGRVVGIAGRARAGALGPPGRRAPPARPRGSHGARPRAEARDARPARLRRGHPRLDAVGRLGGDHRADDGRGVARIAGAHVLLDLREQVRAKRRGHVPVDEHALHADAHLARLRRAFLQGSPTPG